MLNFKNFKVGFLFLGLFILLGQELIASEGNGGFSIFGRSNQYRSSDPYLHPPEDTNNTRSLGEQVSSIRGLLASKDINEKDKAKLRTDLEKYETLYEESLQKKPTRLQRGFRALFASTPLHGIADLGGLEAILLITGMIFLFPFIETSKTFVTKLFKDRIWVAFEGLVGGLTTKTIRTTIHCRELFKSTRDLIALVMRLSAREVGAGMDARARVPNGSATPEKDKDPEKTTEVAAKEAYKCPICLKSEGPMEYFFNCTNGVDHGIHPECAIKFFASSSGKDSNKCCPVCKADRKFDVMSPDAIIASMIDKLNIKSELQSHILILKSAQKKINGLIKQMSKYHDKTKYLTERTMLLAISMDINRLIDLLKKIICQNDFFNQENLKKLDVCAAIGDFNCQTLLKYIQGSRDDVSGLRRDGMGAGYPGSGLGSGFGSGLGGGGF